MKNKEKYFDEIIQATTRFSYCSFVRKYMKDYDFKLKEYKEFNGEKLCSGKECEQCKEHFKRWLEQEYIEQPRLSHDEYVILKNLDGMFKWITRDKWDGFISVHVKVHTYKPEKKDDRWERRLIGSHELIFDHLFQFIKWEDEEPYNIKELLDEYEKYYKEEK